MSGFLGRSWHILLALAGVALVIPAAIGVAHYLHASTALSTPAAETAGDVSPSTVAGNASSADANANISPAAGQITRQLATHGRWLTNTHYGRVWAPSGVSDNWQPYTVGHWSYSNDDGWYWNSDEQWSETYHYGRWYDDPSEGWVWVPGTEWAPSWVAWRETDTETADGGYYGWAPLPPEGYEENAGPAVFDQPGIWAFVAARYLTSSHIHRVMIPHNRNAAIIGGTRVINNARSVDNHGVNRGVDPQRVGQFAHRTVPAFDGHAPAPMPGGAFGHAPAQDRPTAEAARHEQPGRDQPGRDQLGGGAPEGGRDHRFQAADGAADRAGPNHAPQGIAPQGDDQVRHGPAPMAQGERGGINRFGGQDRGMPVAPQPHEPRQPDHANRDSAARPPQPALNEQRGPQSMGQHSQSMMPQPDRAGPQHHGENQGGKPDGGHEGGRERGPGGEGQPQAAPQPGPQGGDQPQAGPRPDGGGGDHGGGPGGNGPGGGGDHHGH